MNFRPEDRQNTFARTRVPATDVNHDLRRAFDIDFHAAALETLDHNAHPTQLRDELERPDDSQLQKVRVL